MNARIGTIEAVLSLDNKPLDSGAQEAERTLTGIESRMKQAGAVIKGFLALEVVKAGAEFVNFANDAWETGQRFDKVFGDMSGSMREWAAEVAAATSSSQLQIETMATKFNVTAKSLGLTKTAAAELTQTVTGLTLDLAEFNNVPVEEMQGAIQSLLTGNTRAMKQYGIVVDDAAIKAEALALGISETGESLNAEQKSLAAVNAVLKQTVDVHGEAAASAGEFGAQLNYIKNGAVDAAASVGNVLIPALADNIKMMRLAAQGAESLWDRLGKRFDEANLETLQSNFERTKKKLEEMDAAGKRGSAEYAKLRDQLQRYAYAMNATNESLQDNMADIAKDGADVDKIMGNVATTMGKSKVNVEGIAKGLGDGKGATGQAQKLKKEIEDIERYAREAAAEAASILNSDSTFQHIESEFNVDVTADAASIAEVQDAYAAAMTAANKDQALQMAATMSSAWASADVGSAVGIALTAGMGPAGSALATVMSPLIDAFDGSADEMYTKLEGLFTSLPIALGNIFQNLGTLLVDLPGMVANAASDPDTWKTLGRVQGAILTGGLSEIAMGIADRIKGDSNDPFDGLTSGQLRQFYDERRLLHEYGDDLRNILTGDGPRGVGSMTGRHWDSYVAAQVAVAQESVAPRANGGYVVSGKQYIGGEQGPEVFTPAQSGYITPTGKGGGTTLSIAPGAVVINAANGYDAGAQFLAFLKDAGRRGELQNAMAQRVGA